MSEKIDVIVGDVTADTSVEAEYAAAVKEEGLVDEEAGGSLTESGEVATPVEETSAPQGDTLETKYEKSKKALKEERELNRQKREELLTSHATELARANERLRMIQESLQIQAQQQAQAQVTPEEIPNAEDDPIGYMNWKLGKQEQELTALKNQTEQQTYQQAQQAQAIEKYNHFMNTYTAKVQEFAQETPDFGDAYRFAVKDKNDELILQGYHDPAERNRRIKGYEFDIVWQAFQDGADPAKRIYEYAKHRGYTGPAPVQEAPPASPTPAPVANLEDARAKQAASQSLGSLGSGAPAGTLTLQTLIEMDEKTINEITEKGGWGEYLKY